MIYFIALSIVAFIICLALSIKLSRARKQGCAIWVMLLGPFGIVSLIWLVMLIASFYKWGNGQ